MARETEPTTQHLLRLYTGDFERLGELHPDLKRSFIVRQLVRKYIRQHDQSIDLEEIGKVSV
jgi:hypothetical protein